jgi:hypothetical protein
MYRYVVRWQQELYQSKKWQCATTKKALSTRTDQNPTDNTTAPAMQGLLHCPDKQDILRKQTMLKCWCQPMQLTSKCERGVSAMVLSSTDNTHDCAIISHEHSPGGSLDHQVMPLQQQRRRSEQFASAN